MTGSTITGTEAQGGPWLAHLPLGIAAFDAGDRLVLANPRAFDLLGGLVGELRLGTAYGDILRHLSRSAAVDRGEQSAGAWTERRLAAEDEASWELVLRDGRSFRIDQRRLPDGGRFAAIVDITALRQGERQMQRLTTIGIALSAEKDLNGLLEMILLEAKAIANADGGTIYLVRESTAGKRPDGLIDRRAGGDRRHRDRRRAEHGPPAGQAERRVPAQRRDTHDRRRPRHQLEFAIVRNDTLGVALGGTTGAAIAFPAIALYDPATGAPNFGNVATYAAITGESVNIPDAYNAAGFDFSGTRRFDEMNRYRSVSFLTIPMLNKADEVIGVLQLINARERGGSTAIPFDRRHQQMIESLASQAAVALDNKLLLDSQKRLFEALIKLIATAIDQKSPYTGGHCARVPALTEMIAEAACNASEGPFRSFELTPDEQFELHVAGWLHDCGKITTPEYIVDKSTKLETIYDRINTVDVRFEVLKRDAEIAYLRALAEDGADGAALAAAYEARLAAIEADRAFLRDANLGGEFLDPAKIERIKAIAGQHWRAADGTKRELLSEEEVYNLSISRGTLTAEERKIMNEHMTVTIQMLEQLPFPKGLRRVPEYAGGHHEKMDGTGFPRGLKREQMSIPARIMAIADIFEALTAADRPYKKAKTLSESMAIMARMRDADHIDPELFALFVETGVYREYARRFLNPEQIDEVDHDRVLARGKPRG
ncbi:MAG: HD domain-containing phosphohydrolase [Alphaproteobacteria bacterium]